MFLVLAILLAPIAVLALQMRFPNISGLYHDHTKRVQQAILHTIDLNNIGTVMILEQLLVHPMFDLAKIYNEGCGLLTKDRINKILSLVVGRKDLEMLLLGTGCLSDKIIETRKKHKMWPPTGIPLLIKGFDLTGRSVQDSKEVLWEALRHPELWYSRHWIWDFDWDQMDDLGFWRLIMMAPPSSSHSIFSYLKASLLAINSYSSHRDVEEFLMKSLRMLAFDQLSIEADQEWAFLCDKEGLLSRFERIRLAGGWCERALGIIHKLCVDGLKIFPLALLNSELLVLETWQEVLNTGLIDMRVVVIDMLELFILGLKIEWNDPVKEAIEQLAIASTTKLVDPLSPVVTAEFLSAICHKKCHTLIAEHIKRWLNDGRLLSLMGDWAPAKYWNPKLMWYRIKRRIGPLMDSLVRRRAESSYPLRLYTQTLYEHWLSSGFKWPGLLAAHRYQENAIRAIFSPSTIDRNTWEPNLRVATNIHVWEWAFSSIRFAVQHGVPPAVVPSICFLRVLLYLSQGDQSWNELVERAGQECIFPEDSTEQSQYWNIVNIAKSELFRKPSELPRTSAKLLQAVIRGDEISD